MTNEVILEKSGERTVAFDVPIRDSNGWLESYRVRVIEAGLSAVTHVENSPYGQDPSVFFKELADSWRGWAGEKQWRAMEDELRLSATCDSLGHIRLRIELSPDAFPRNWSVLSYVHFEAGQLDSLHHRVARFFAHES